MKKCQGQMDAVEMKGRVIGAQVKELSMQRGREEVVVVVVVVVEEEEARKKQRACANARNAEEARDSCVHT